MQKMKGRESQLCVAESFRRTRTRILRGGDLGNSSGAPLGRVSSHICITFDAHGRPRDGALDFFVGVILGSKSSRPIRVTVTTALANRTRFLPVLPPAPAGFYSTNMSAFPRAEGKATGDPALGTVVPEMQI
jgi:hypothetical protein